MGQLDRSAFNLEFDEEGFLRDPGQWNEQVAFRLARLSGIPRLDDEHWMVITHLRAHWMQHRRISSESQVCHLSHQGPDCLEMLFPKPRDAWRIAGLPNPGDEAKPLLS